MKRSVQYASMLATLLAGSVALAGQNNLPDYSAYANAQEVSGPLTSGVVPQEFLAGVGSIDEKRGVPTIYWAPSGGVVAPGGFMARPESAGQFYLEHYASLYGLSQSALDTAYVQQVHDIGTGAIIVIFQQKANGIDVHNTALKVLMTQGLELVAITGNLNLLASPKMGRTAPFRLTPEDTIARSFNDYFRTNVPPSAFQDMGKPEHGYSFYELQTKAAAGLPGTLTRPARIKKVYYPLPDKLVPAYYIELWTSGPSGNPLYSYVMAADDGRLLQRQSLTKEAAFQYKVWNEGTPTFKPPDGPQADYEPHPAGMPNGTSPAFVNQTTITVDGLNTNPSATFDPWLPAGATFTNGNNVDAYVDLDATDGLNGTDFRANVSAPGVFSYTYNTNQAPTANTTQQKASITQLFVQVNYLHDYWYDSGFNEAAGNAQVNNLGRGGVGNDPILAEAQDTANAGAAANYDNANMSTPADGASPRMQMYVFQTVPAGSPDRDGSIDNGISGHEWGHYLHMRNSSGGNDQYSAMSEGWADFQALMMLVHANDSTAGAFSGTFATGIYASAGFQDSPYYGIRRYPYSKNFAKNGLTFKHIMNSSTLPAGYSPVFAANPNAEAHNAGEIWCSMMWEGYSNLLNDTLGATPRHTFDQAKRKMSNYVVAGLKLAPYDPTYTEHRDGVIAAAVAGGNVQDYTEIMSGFATRGAGPCAVSPARTATAQQGLPGVVEDFTNNRAKASFVSLTVKEGTPNCDNDGILDVGETGYVAVTVQNTGWAALNGATVTLTSGTPNVTFPSGNSMALPSTGALATGTVNIPISLGAAITVPTYITFTVSINAPGTCVTTVNGTGDGEVMYDVTVPNSATGSTTEAFEGTKTWSGKINGTGAPTTLWDINRPALPAPIGINQVAWGQDISGVSDHTWESPDLVVGNAGFSVTFQHRYDFERSRPAPGQPFENWDGGVIEISQDNGMTWADISTFAGVTTGYFGPVSTLASNPLAGRQAYAGQSANFLTGGMISRTLNFGNALNNKTVRMRFRIGTDEAVGAGGWFIDNLAFTGLTNKPFSAQVNHNCVSGQCGNGMLNAGEACDDGNTANGDCCSSACQFESAATVCRAANGACDVAETCTGNSATCPADMKAANGAACTDNNACTQMDTCQNGACVAGMAVTCAAMDACHMAGTCDTMTGLCSNPNAPNGTMCNDSNACTMTDSCQNGACTGTNPVMCAALDQCHVAGTCDSVSGMCSNPNAPDGSSCNDSNLCTQMDTCQAGTCTGANPVMCAAMDACHVAGTCNPMNGTCSNPAAADGTACNDSNGCTQTDTCQAGACTGANPVTCAASDQCHAVGTCDSASGMCSNPNAADGTSCNDNDLCTTTDSCTNGACAGTPVTCTGDECHDAGGCDAATGMCNNPAKPDGTPCNNGGTCQAGACSVGTGGAGGTGGTGGAGGEAGEGGAAGEAGKGGAGGGGGSAEGGAGGSAGGSTKPPVVTEGGCDCSIPGSDAPTRDVGGSLLALFGAWLVRRRRNGKRS